MIVALMAHVFMIVKLLPKQCKKSPYEPCIVIIIIIIKCLWYCFLVEIFKSE